MLGRILIRAFQASLCIAAALALAAPLAPREAAALGRISENALRANLSFLASDLLEGRDTPSRGLDIAAEYIAAQFRRAGLEPAGGDGYFQTAPFVLSRLKPGGSEIKLEARGETISVRDISSMLNPQPLDIQGAAVVAPGRGAALPAAKDVEGKVVVMAGDELPRADRTRLLALRPLLVVMVGPEYGAGRAAGPQLANPADREDFPPLMIVSSDALAKALHDGLADARITVRLDAPEEEPVTLRNVIGLLRSSDPQLRDTYILVTAHYDHIGVAPECGAPDCIFNGANDNASSAVSVIELAAALAGLRPRPRRSIVFMTLFGEEQGRLGARYYTRNPRFPIAQTVANVNLEQLGRTDATEGRRVSTATLTGWTFSSIPKVFQAAGLRTGVHVRNTDNSAAYFRRGDNAAFADAGIPAHTVVVAYDYPDYHRVTDSWEKIDYANLAKINRMLALGLIMLAESPQEPRWNESEPEAARYVEERRAGRPAK